MMEDGITWKTIRPPEKINPRNMTVAGVFSSHKFPWQIEAMLIQFRNFNHGNRLVILQELRRYDLIVG